MSAGALLGASASEPLPLKVANLSQDVSFLIKETAQLRLDMESLTRENEMLKKQIEHFGTAENQVKKQGAQITALNVTLESYKKTMLTEIAEEMEEFSRQTQKAIDQLAKAVVTKSEASKDSLKFSEDYPKEGIAYTVKTGDTISVIAVKQGSTIRDIQNANRITDPRELKAGQVIFIPTKK